MGVGGEDGHLSFPSSLRGEEFSSVSPVWPAEARWHLQLIAQQRLVWNEWEKGKEDKTEAG